MKIQYYKEYSFKLNRDMEFKIYGHRGIPCLVIPAQNGRFYDFENFQMLEACRPFVEEGRVQFFCVDSIDLESWSSTNTSSRARIEQHERWYNYICDEFVPIIKRINAESNDHKKNDIIITGCSMGAAHALNFFLRRPDLFTSVISLSGIYDAAYFFEDYSDDLVYNNSPINYLNNMPLDHFYIEMYQNRKIILCVGQGQWEESMIEDTKKIESIFKDKKIPAWIDYWGFDVNHDWPWWRKQLPYYLNTLI